MKVINADKQLSRLNALYDDAARFDDDDFSSGKASAYWSVIQMVESMEHIDKWVRPKGQWIWDRPHHWRCSNCGVTIGMTALMSDFCYRCGSYNHAVGREVYGDMQEEEEL